MGKPNNDPYQLSNEAITERGTINHRVLLGNIYREHQIG